MATQIKFTVDDAVAERFKQFVLRKHGKLELSKEGEEALRRYLAKEEARPRKSKRDPLLDAIGMCTPRRAGKTDALALKKALYDEA